MRAGIAGVGCDGFAPGSADQAHVAQQQPVHLHGGDLACGEADHDEPSEACQRPDPVEEAVAAHRVVGHVDAPTAGELAHLVLPGVADEHDVIGSCRPGDLTLCLGGDQADHRPGADPLRHLDARGAYSARGAEHQHRLALAQTRPVDHAEHGGLVVHDQRRPLFE